MYSRCTVIFFVFFFAMSTAMASGDYLDRSEVKSFIQTFCKQHQYLEASLYDLLGNVKKQTQVLEAIRRPAEKKKNWQEYRKIFITEKRVSEGLRYWAKNAQILAAAEQQYGVAPEIIVAIIGVETFYGRYEGEYPVLDSLVTLGFDYPPRQKFFRSELEHFLLLAQEEELDPIKIRGSYAGAMGKSQFISSSYREFAIDFDENGKRDLWGSDDDVIGSVANYFNRHGWQANQPITAQVTVQDDRYTNLLSKGIKPAVPVAELAQFGIEVIGSNLHAQEKAALLELKNDNANEYWVGFNNFYVITRYNHSQMYAMVVYQLSQQIKQGIKNYVAQD